MNIGKIPAKTARLSPHREALVDIPNDRRMSYGELDQRVCRLANAFIDHLGLQKGDRVAILSKNCIEYMEIYYACARCGLIAQPLNWRLGTEELVRILHDGEPSAVIVSGEYAGERERLSEQVKARHWLGFGAGSDQSYDALVAQGSDCEPPGSDSIGGDDPVLILYTGGTT